jgi:hypothetical protein
MKRPPHKTIHIKRATLVQLFADDPVVPKNYKHYKRRSLFDWQYERDLARLARTKPNRLKVGLVRAMTGNPFFFNGAHVGAEND